MHTKPWKFDLEFFCGTPARYQVDTNILVFGMDGEEGIYLDNPDDASLIDAAPDLLNACLSAQARLMELEPDWAASDELRTLKTAIAKAKATKPMGVYPDQINQPGCPHHAICTHCGYTAGDHVRKPLWEPKGFRCPTRREMDHEREHTRQNPDND